MFLFYIKVGKTSFVYGTEQILLQKVYWTTLGLDHTFIIIIVFIYIYLSMHAILSASESDMISSNMSKYAYSPNS